MVGYKKYFFRVLFIVLILNFSFSYGQSEMDTLQKKSFDELKQGFYSNLKDTIKLKIYANAYLKKGKNNKDSLNISKGYHYSYILDKNNNVGQDYLDSIITVSKNKDYELYPLIAYNLKSRFYFKNHNYEKCLVYLFKAKNCNKGKYYDIEMDLQVNHSVALIKSRLGNYREALTLFLKNEKYYSNNKNYLTTLFAIADSYRFLKKLDSSSYYNSKGIKASLKQKNSNWYNYFLLNEGATLSDKGFYVISNDSIEKGLSNIIQVDDKLNTAMAYYFLGINNFALNKKAKAMSYFKKVDSIFFISKDIHPELRKGYELLINESKLNNNLEEEIIYINKLLELDKTLYNNYRILSKKIIQEYDTPKLLAKKNFLIKKAERKNSNYSFFIFVLAVIIIAIAIYLKKVIKKQKIDRQKLELLLKKKHVSENTSVDKKEQIKSLKINPKITTNVLNALERFENNKEYLDNKITAHNLAKKIGTNTQYLSKIINHYKGGNFSNYLNNLRIEYAINKLSTDKQYMKYTIEAIANEVGFNSSESFSTAFYKKTGIKPSYFRKNFEKVNRNL
jgi:AraC-like DNA-binding protein